LAFATSAADAVAKEKGRAGANDWGIDLTGVGAEEGGSGRVRGETVWGGGDGLVAVPGSQFSENTFTFRNRETLGTIESQRLEVRLQK